MASKPVANAAVSVLQDLVGHNITRCGWLWPEGQATHLLVLWPGLPVIQPGNWVVGGDHLLFLLLLFDTMCSFALRLCKLTAAHGFSGHPPWSPFVVVSACEPATIFLCIINLCMLTLCTHATPSVLLYLHTACVDPGMSPHDTPPLPADMHRDNHAQATVSRFAAQHMHSAAQPWSKICEHPSHPGTS